MALPSPTRTDDVVHAPYIPSARAPAELTPGVILLGIVLGLMFAASSVYLALKVSLTVSASIPVAVLSITIFRYMARVLRRPPATILQNNMVQTTGSAGESIAAGISFTLPALLLLGYDLPWSTVMAIGIVGGVLGVIFMIPLRRSLIVKEHANLKYPEGTACAQVLIVGEERGVQAKTVFMGFGLGAAYKFLTSGLHLWLEIPKHTFQRVVAGARPQLFGEIQAEISPELTGVGYIIGPRIAGYLFGGGVISWFALIPSIKFFRSGFTTPIFPANKLIADMTARDEVPRTERDLPMSVVVVGALVCGIAMVVLPQIHINIVGAVLALLFSFLFVTVSSRITGQIGSSSNPISGMTVATLLLTSLMFLAAGWVGIEYRVLALSIGGVVCVAASTAGATSQDLKTGFLVGATPRSQQIGLLFGVTASALLVGGIVHFLNEAKTTIVPRDYPGVTAKDIGQTHFSLGAGRMNEEPDLGSTSGPTFRVGRLYEQTGNAPAGKYLVDDAGQIRYLIDPGLGGRERKNYDGREIDKLESPKGQIMALVVDGILTQKLPWGLILIGAFLAIAMELIGVPALPVAVGAYLPISTSATMFMGGVLRWIIDRRLTPEERDGPQADSGPGVLFASGLIAGGAITGVVLAALQAKGLDAAIDLSRSVGSSSASLAMIAFIALLAIPVYAVARSRRSP